MYFVINCLLIILYICKKYRNITVIIIEDLFLVHFKFIYICNIHHKRVSIFSYFYMNNSIYLLKTTIFLLLGTFKTCKCLLFFYAPIYAIGIELIRIHF